MPTNTYPNGIGASLGPQVALNKPFFCSGNVWYVDSQTGTDAASPAGRNREKPLATLGQANTNAATDDFIVLLSGHSETLTGALTISKRLTIIGEGTASGKPTVKFTNNQAAGSLFTNTGHALRLYNIWFEENAQTNTAALITVAAMQDFAMNGCYVELGSNDTGFAVVLTDSTFVTFRDTTFISTATSGTQPKGAIQFATSGGNPTSIRMDGLTLDAGTIGFSNHFAVDGSAVAVLRLFADNVNLLHGADMTFNSLTIGYLSLGTLTGGSKVVW